MQTIGKTAPWYLLGMAIGAAVYLATPRKRRAAKQQRLKPFHYTDDAIGIGGGELRHEAVAA